MRFCLDCHRASHAGLMGLMLCLTGACASNGEVPNLAITQVSDSIFIAVGETVAPSYENWGHSNNLSFAIGDEAVLAAMMAREKDRGDKTFVVIPAVTFSESKTVGLGGTIVELKRFGEAHPPGDISVWIGAQKILIAGDIAFHERLLGVFPDTNVRGWLESFERMMALQPVLVVPGHGRPTQIETLKTYTYDYLSYLAEAYDIDQTAYQHLDTFDELAVKNAGRVYQMLQLELF